MDAVAHFSQLARYNAWATARLLDAVRAVEEADYRRDMGLFFKSIHGTLNHLLVAEHHLWYPRFAEGASLRVALDAELEPGRARLDARLREGAARWERLVAAVPAERWDGALDYTTMRGDAASLPFAATLAMCSTTARTTAARPRRRSPHWASRVPRWTLSITCKTPRSHDAKPFHHPVRCSGAHHLDPARDPQRLQR